jgi:hypothetical protein
VQSINLSPPTTLPDGTYGTAYNGQAISATEVGYGGSFTFAVTGGALPDGLADTDASGALMGGLLPDGTRLTAALDSVFAQSPF